MFSHQKDRDEKKASSRRMRLNGEKGTRTLHPQIANLMLYQMSYFPIFFQSLLGLFGILDLIKDLLQFQGYVYIVNHRPENSVHILALKGDRREV